MTATMACTNCGHHVTELDNGMTCPRCGGLVKEVRFVKVRAADVVAISSHESASVSATIHASAGIALAVGEAATIMAISRYAGGWYADAQREAGQPTGDYHARRREIVSAVCCAESYIYEWTFDLVRQTGAADTDVDRYFPPEPEEGRNRSVTAQWKEVPKLLHQAGLLPCRPDFGGPHGDDWLQLVKYRNGLVHALISRPEKWGSGPPVRPIVTTSDLQGLTAGWATEVVAERIRRLHAAAGTPPPDWLVASLATSTSGD